MANSADASQQLSREKYGNCAICKSYIGISAPKVTCCKCMGGIHLKCFQACAKVFVISENDWICRDCMTSTDMAAGRDANSSIEVLLHCVLNELNVLKAEVTSLKVSNSGLMQEIKRADYSSAVKSAQGLPKFQTQQKAVSVEKVNDTNASSQEHMINANKKVTASLESELREQNRIMSKITYVNNDMSAPETATTNAPDEVFKTVTRKRRHVRGNQPPSNEDPFKAAVKSTYVYVGNLALDTQCTNIENYLKTKFNDRQFKVENLPKRDNAKSIAFKVTVDEDLFSDLLNANIWPKGVYVKKFHFLRRANGTDTKV